MTTRVSLADASNLLSAIVLDDLETTMRPAAEDDADIQLDVNIVSDDDENEDENKNNDTDETLDNLNDSITKLKQTANTESKTSKPTAEAKSDPNVSKKRPKMLRYVQN